MENPWFSGYIGPGSSFYGPGSRETGDSIPSFLKREDVPAKNKILKNRDPLRECNEVRTFFESTTEKIEIPVYNFPARLKSK